MPMADITQRWILCAEQSTLTQPFLDPHSRMFAGPSWTTVTTSLDSCHSVLISARRVVMLSWVCRSSVHVCVCQRRPTTSSTMEWCNWRWSWCMGRLPGWSRCQLWRQLQWRPTLSLPAALAVSLLLACRDELSSSYNRVTCMMAPRTPAERGILSLQQVKLAACCQLGGRRWGPWFSPGATRIRNDAVQRQMSWLLADWVTSTALRPDGLPEHEPSA